MEMIPTSAKKATLVRALLPVAALIGSMFSLTTVFAADGKTGEAMEKTTEQNTTPKSNQNLSDFKVQAADGTTKNLADYKGKVVMVVNVASKCGFTPQYTELEQVYETYKDKGFVILGFPCNQFGQQEPGTNAEIQHFCKANYGVTFPVFAKIDVNGDGTDPLYKWMKSQSKGVLGTESIKWNFTKFLIGRDGQVITRYASADKPKSLTKDIEKALAQ